MSFSFSIVTKSQLKPDRDHNIMASQPNYRFLAEKLKDFAERLRRNNEDMSHQTKDRNKRVDEIEWCIQGLDGYCS